MHITTAAIITAQLVKTMMYHIHVYTFKCRGSFGAVVNILMAYIDKQAVAANEPPSGCSSCVKPALELPQYSAASHPKVVKLCTGSVLPNLNPCVCVMHSLVIPNLFVLYSQPLLLSCQTCAFGITTSVGYSTQTDLKRQGYASQFTYMYSAVIIHGIGTQQGFVVL